jgi:hypothetical protein
VDGIQCVGYDFFNLPFVEPQGTNHSFNFLYISLLVKINNQIITTLQFIIRIMLIRGAFGNLNRERMTPMISKKQRQSSPRRNVNPNYRAMMRTSTKVMPPVVLQDMLGLSGRRKMMAR